MLLGGEFAYDVIAAHIPQRLLIRAMAAAAGKRDDGAVCIFDTWPCIR